MANPIKALMAGLKEDVLKPILVKNQVAKNQNELVKLTVENDILHLKLKSAIGCPGSPQHYYHFLFDVVLPLHVLIQRVGPKVSFYIDECGSFNSFLPVLFPGRILSSEEFAKTTLIAKGDLVGMNPRAMRLSESLHQSFKADIATALNAKLSADSKIILLIERVAPSQEFLEKTSTASKAGANRRAILNHSEVREFLQAHLKPGYVVENVRLEEMNMKEQVEAFDRAALVIGQHGAGLANLVWQKPNKAVLEISHRPELTYFKKLAADKKLDFSLYETSSSHPTIDVEHFKLWLKNHEGFDKFFSL